MTFDEMEKTPRYDTKFNAKDFASSFESPILKKHCIDTKEKWLKWATKNHPDKGGDLEIFRQVIHAVRLKFYDD